MQRRFWNWRDDDLTVDINQWLIGLIDSGRYRGFDPVLDGTMVLKLNHATTGAIRVNSLQNYTGKFGILSTKQGVIVQEYETIELTVPTTPAGKYRKGIVVFTHRYQSIEGGEEGIYSLIMSAETTIGESVDFPTLPQEEIQTVIGYLEIPENCVSLNDPNVLYIQAAQPNFANHVAFIEKSNGFFLTDLDARSNKIVRLATCTDDYDAANKLYVDQAIANNVVWATELRRGIIEIANSLEAVAMTDNERAITPAKWKEAYDSKKASQSETNDDVEQDKYITPKTLANRTATETRKGVARIATEAEAILGEDDTTIITPYKLKKALPLVPVVVELGDWDINSSQTTSLLHTLGVNWDKVVAMDITIRKDDGSMIFNPNYVNISVDSSHAEIELTGTGLTLTEFNATGFNRGHIVFWLKLDIPAFTGYLSVNAGVDITLNASSIAYGTPVLRETVRLVGTDRFSAEVFMGTGTTNTLPTIELRKTGTTTWINASNVVNVSNTATPQYKKLNCTVIDSPVGTTYEVRAIVIIGGRTLVSNVVTMNITAASGTVTTGGVDGDSVLEGTSVNLNGFVDAVGEPVTSKLWTVVSKPSGSNVVFVDDTNEVTTASLDMFGTYVLKLEAETDNNNAEDEITINVVQQANIAPVISSVVVGGSYAEPDLDDPYGNGLIPFGGWQRQDIVVNATDADNDPISYTVVQVDSYSHITGAYGNPVVGSNLIYEADPATPHLITIRGMFINGGSAYGGFYFFKVTADDGRGGTDTKGFRVKVNSSTTLPSFTIVATPEYEPYPITDEWVGALNINPVSNVAQLTATITISSGNTSLHGVTIAQLLIGSSVYNVGTWNITGHKASNMPFRFRVNPSIYSAEAFIGTAQVTFRAYDNYGNLLGSAEATCMVV